jgi:hypothetical protein
MKVLFVTALQDLSVSEYLGRGDKITPQLFITNDKSVINEIVSDELKVMAGSIECKYIKESDLIIYGNIAVNEKEFIAKDYLIYQMHVSKFFLNFLWLIKDNSANFDMAYLQYPELRSTRIDSNYIATLYSNCRGGRDKITFTRNELKLSRHLFRTRFTKEPMEYQKGTYFLKGINRISVAFYFLQSARTEKDLAIRIVNYVTCFESLFSTSTVELTHQLAERIAFFIGTDSQERHDLFSKIKEAYGIRSKILHGELLTSSKIDKLYDISKNCDDLLRTVLFKLLSNKDLSDIFSSPKNELDDYFLKLILG